MIETYDESNCEVAIGRVIFNFIKTGRDDTEMKIVGNELL